jgi:signal peptidase I
MAPGDPPAVVPPNQAQWVLEPGDIVTFHPTPGVTVTHRVAAVDANGITTKGDANSSNDVGYLPPDLVVGRVAFVVPYGGYVVVFFQHPVGVVALLGLVFALAGIWILTEDRPRASDPASTADRVSARGAANASARRRDYPA